MQIVAEQPVTATDPTVDTQLSNLKASGADTLVIIAAPKQSAQAVRFAAESGWHPLTLVSYIASSVYRAATGRAREREGCDHQPVHQAHRRLRPRRRGATSTSPTMRWCGPGSNRATRSGTWAT